MSNENESTSEMESRLARKMFYDGTLRVVTGIGSLLFVILWYLVTRQMEATDRQLQALWKTEAEIRNDINKVQGDILATEVKIKGLYDSVNALNQGSNERANKLGRIEAYLEELMAARRNGGNIK